MLFKRLRSSENWKALLALMPSTAMIFMDTSIIPVALPTIQRQFQASNLELQWMVNSYLLVMAVLILAGGKLGDRFGKKKGYSIGLCLFLISSILCAVSMNGTALIIARALLGLGASIMIPMSMGIISKAFPEHLRGSAIGVSVSVGSIFLIVGPFVGGFFTEFISWRWSFWINVPIGIVGLILTYLYIPKMKGKEETFDFPGFLTYSLGVFLIIFALMQSREWGFLSSSFFLALFSGLFFLLLLFFTTKRARHPFVDFSIYRKRAFLMSAAAIFSTQFFMMITVFWAIYYQNILGYDPFLAGLITITSTFPVIFMAPIAGRLADSYPAIVPIRIGFSLMFVGFLWISCFIYSADDFWILLPGLIAFGASVPMVLTPSTTQVIRTVTHEKMGASSGALNMLRYLGGTFGVALIGAVILWSDNWMVERQLIEEVNETREMIHFYAERYAYFMGTLLITLLTPIAYFFIHRLIPK